MLRIVVACTLFVRTEMTLELNQGRLMMLSHRIIPTPPPLRFSKIPCHIDRPSALPSSVSSRSLSLSRLSLKPYRLARPSREEKEREKQSSLYHVSCMYHAWVGERHTELKEYPSSRRVGFGDCGVRGWSGLCGILVNVLANGFLVRLHGVLGCHWRLLLMVG